MESTCNALAREMASASVATVNALERKLLVTYTLFGRVASLLSVVVFSSCSNGPTAPSPATGTANPLGTHTLSGTILATGGGAIEGVALTTDRGKNAVTDENGQYRIQGLSGLVNVALGRAGYETSFGFSEFLDRDHIVNAVIQRTIQMAPGDRTEITVFRDDPDYDLAYAVCSAPCKRIRTAGPGGTLISIRARARDEARSVCLLVDGGPPYFSNPTCSTTEVTATAMSLLGGGEFQFYVKFGDGYREGSQGVEVSVTVGTQP